MWMSQKDTDKDIELLWVGYVFFMRNDFIEIICILINLYAAFLSQEKFMNTYIYVYECIYTLERVQQIFPSGYSWERTRAWGQGADVKEGFPQL